MQPMRPHLKDTSQILVSPDGVLHLVPFGALVDERDQYLLETLVSATSRREKVSLDCVGPSWPLARKRWL
jgi:hypothetical protein